MWIASVLQWAWACLLRLWSSRSLRRIAPILSAWCAPRPRRRQELHVILDNLSAHKTKAVRAWQASHPNVHFHFTPTYSSWLNQVELWFAKIERDVIARGIFTSVPDLRKKLRQDIALHNKTAQPFQWIYDNPKRRVRAIRNSLSVH